MKIRLSAVCLALLACSACGPESQGERANAATCEAGKVHLIGEVEGRAIDESHDVSGFYFVQVGEVALDMTFGETGHLRLEWETLVADGDEVDVSKGELVMPGSTDTLMAEEGSSLIPTGDAYQFRLYWPDGSSLDGCYAQAEF
ncbi:MAG: hypothetical protein HOW73_37625 [Polyangiaceae bacterium]|nr:hypothetical protein [Polyangiaceae bacterium]